MNEVNKTQLLYLLILYKASPLCQNRQAVQHIIETLKQDSENGPLSN